jgi:hypothetical protein
MSDETLPPTEKRTAASLPPHGKRHMEEMDRLHHHIWERAQAAGFEPAYVAGAGGIKDAPGFVFRRKIDVVEAESPTSAPRLKGEFMVCWYPSSLVPITTVLDWLDLFPETAEGQQ